MEGAVNNTKEITSMEVAKLVGYKHKYLLQKIREMAGSWKAEGGRQIAPTSYFDAQGKKRPCYKLDKEQWLYVTSKFRNDVRAKLVRRWNEVETELHEIKSSSAYNKDVPAVQFKVPKTFAQALRLAAEQQEKIEQQQLLLAQANNAVAELDIKVNEQKEQIEQMEKKVTYLDKVLSCPESVLTTVIAKDYGMSAVKFNEMLSSFRIQYRIGEQWVLYQPYASESFVKSVTFTFTKENGQLAAKSNTQWTQKGRMWLYEFLKKKGIVPRIEQKDLFDE